MLIEKKKKEKKRCITYYFPNNVYTIFCLKRKARKFDTKLILNCMVKMIKIVDNLIILFRTRYV